MSNTTKSILHITCKEKVKFDIFSQAEENLYIDMLIKTDENIRRKASDYAGYLEEFQEYKEYIELKNQGLEIEDIEDIIAFLRSKEKINSNKEQKREYMKGKFDYIEKINNTEKNLKPKLSEYFPVLGNGKIEDLNDNDLTELYTKWKEEDINTDDLGPYIIPFLIPKITNKRVTWHLVSFTLSKKYLEEEKENKNKNNLLNEL